MMKLISIVISIARFYSTTSIYNSNNEYLVSIVQLQRFGNDYNDE